MGLIKKLRKAKKEAAPNEKPAVVKTHLRDMIIVPEMIGSVVGIYNGKVRSLYCAIYFHDLKSRKRTTILLCVMHFDLLNTGFQLS